MKNKRGMSARDIEGLAIGIGFGMKAAAAIVRHLATIQPEMTTLAQSIDDVAERGHGLLGLCAARYRHEDSPSEHVAAEALRLWIASQA